MFRFIDLFAGIGGFRIALEGLGGRCVASSEIDKSAVEVYRRNWPDDDEDHNLGDVRDIKELPEHDVLVGGVPCQAFSIAGKNEGISDDRGKLWNDAIRLVGLGRPKAFIYENVKGLLDPRHNETLVFLLKSFRNCCGDGSYKVHHKLLNSYDFGVPQNRDRLFIVGTRKDVLRDEFQWPTTSKEYRFLYEVLDGLEVPLEAPAYPIYQRDLFGDRIEGGFNKLVPNGGRNPFFPLADIRDGPTTIHSWDIKDVSEREKEICITIMRNRRNSKYGDSDGNPMSFEDIKELMS